MKSIILCCLFSILFSFPAFAENVIVEKGATENSRTYHHKKSKLSDGEIALIKSVPGVKGAFFLDKYEVRVFKGKCFSWSHIDQAITFLLERGEKDSIDDFFRGQNIDYEIKFYASIKPGGVFRVGPVEVVVKDEKRGE